MESRNLEVAVLSIGVINIPTGKTKYGWSVYKNSSDTQSLFLAGNFLLYANKGSFVVGDKILMRNNDSNRKIGQSTIVAELSTNKETLIKQLLEHEFDYRELRAFTKKKFSNKLQTSFSVKGIQLLK